MKALLILCLLAGAALADDVWVGTSWELGQYEFSRFRDQNGNEYSSSSWPVGDRRFHKIEVNNSQSGEGKPDNLRLLFSDGYLPRKYFEHEPTYEEIINGIEPVNRQAVALGYEQSYKATPEYQRLMVQHQKNMMYADLAEKAFDIILAPVDAAGTTRLEKMTGGILTLPSQIIGKFLSAEKPREMPKEWK